ncbi:glial cell line-derived neurotrophic factor [Dunckerocampus dactyliophorus]|uniref:glial cell line-derived neurotrophic factor n=1 Tax=Dunckerocampus dactyliophorus TaxID=161453 RepID=UPI002407301D|nr:glial cell line-derived neurotrophic factor [Dunckerocampus dactyliophorus]
MKLWHSLTTCLILLGAVHAGQAPLARSRQRLSSGREVPKKESPLESPPLRISLSVNSQDVSRSQEDADDWEDQYTMEEPLPAEFEDVVDLIKVTVSRIRRSPSSPTESSQASQSPRTSKSERNPSNRARHIRRKRKNGSSRVRNTRTKGGARGKKTGSGRGQGCVLKQIQLNVTDLGLGYRSDEEMIFRYCAGPCRKSETNYDKILYNLAQRRRFPAKDTPPQACCRPIAFDDDLSFLDDNLVYHTVRKHSARKCACV